MGTRESLRSRNKNQISFFNYRADFTDGGHNDETGHTDCPLIAYQTSLNILHRI